MNDQAGPQDSERKVRRPDELTTGPVPARKPDVVRGPDGVDKTEGPRSEMAEVEPTLVLSETQSHGD